MNQFPIDPKSSPQIIHELLLRMKVKDAMNTRIYSVSKKNTFRDVQKIMREHKISGVPVVEHNRLVGIITLDDLIRAFDNNYVEDKIEPYITKDVVYLEEEMPLVIAISYFNKYSFRRFPVISKNKKLVGILTSRDILVKLISELDREITNLEEKISVPPVTIDNELNIDFLVKRYDFENAGNASSSVKRILEEKNISPKIIRRVGIISFELEMNIIIHSLGGKIIMNMDNEKITIIAKDRGPGIPNIELAMEEGFSTANDWIRNIGFGAGMGLPNVKRFSDEFEIQSEVGKKTIVKSVVYLKDRGEAQ